MADGSAGRTRAGILGAVRDRLVEQIEGAQHEDGCECICGARAGDPRVLTALVRELRAVLADLDELERGPAGGGKSGDASGEAAGDDIDELAARRAGRLADAAGQ